MRRDGEMITEAVPATPAEEITASGYDGALAEDEFVRKKRLPIGDEEIREAARILKEYKGGKQFFDAHIVKDEKWWELRHWEQLNAEDGEAASELERGEIDPKSAWAFNSVINKHADFMDSVPTFAVLPREQNDEGAASILTAILPVIYEQNGYEEKYDAVSLDKCIHGTGCYGVFWDGGKLGGLGDVTITSVDVLRLFWEPGINDIQESTHLFYVTEITRESAGFIYPELKERFNATVSGTVEEYDTVDYVDKSKKIEVVDWYYHRGDILHLCKFAAGILLFSSENEPENYPLGIYRHGKYPFFIDRLYPVKSSPAGFGIIDIAMSDQEIIDRLSREVVNDALGSGPKTFIRDDAGVNDEDISDPKKRIVKFTGTLDDKNFRTVQPTSNASLLMSVVREKIMQLKETTGNNDVASGGIPTGVTAASAIAALQEQAGKTSRDSIKASYRVHAEVARCVIELIREFYDMPRTFRITGENGAHRYESFSNKQLKTREISRLDGTPIEVDPLFDISVSAQKSSPYSAMAQNELAIQFYNAGFFNPKNADMAIAAIEMMDFKDKDKIINRISQQGTLYSMVTELSRRLAAAEAALGAKTATAERGAEVGSGGKMLRVSETGGIGAVTEEPTNVRKARERARESTQPR